MGIVRVIGRLLLVLLRFTVATGILAGFATDESLALTGWFAYREVQLTSIPRVLEDCSHHRHRTDSLADHAGIRHVAEDRRSLLLQVGQIPQAHRIGVVVLVGDIRLAGRSPDFGVDSRTGLAIGRGIGIGFEGGIPGVDRDIDVALEEDTGRIDQTL